MPGGRTRRQLAILLIALLIASGCSYFNHAEEFCTANGRVDEIVTINDSVYLAGSFDELIDPRSAVICWCVTVAASAAIDGFGAGQNLPHAYSGQPTPHRLTSALQAH